MRSKWRLILALIVALGSVTSAFGQASREKLTVGWSSFDATHTPIWVTKETGIFEQEGLDVELVYLESGTAATQALVDGQADVVSTGGSAALNARAAGAPIKIIASLSNRLFQEIWVTRDITQPSDIKGKKWGISSFGSEAHLAAVLALERWGLKADRDVVLIPISGGPSGRLAALSKGTVSATTLLPPAIQQAAESGSVRRFGNTSDITPEFMSLPIAVMEPTIQKRRGALERFLVAMAKGVERTRKDREASIAAVAKYLNLKGKTADAAAAYDFYREVAPVNLRPSLEGVQFVLNSLDNPRAKTVPPADCVALEMLNDLSQRGLIPR